MKKILLIVLLAVFMLWGCSGNKSSDDKTEIKGDTSIAYVDKIPAGAKKILLKSVIIHMKSSTFGMTQNIVIYMDDYGRKQLAEVSQELLGKKVRQCSLVDSVYMYSYNPDDKTGKRTMVEAKGPDNINFNAITHDMAKELNLKKNGTAELLGRQCDVYTMEIASAKLKGTYYIWKGIPLKTVSTVAGISITMEATQIEENAVIPPEKFEIPEDINFEDVAAGH
ncbi:MAG TPA: hypothetical protein PKW80_13915 [Bacteroidales bacterium]|nr:hypothetical protein [Bacteroidales bacterium]